MVRAFTGQIFRWLLETKQLPPAPSWPPLALLFPLQWFWGPTSAHFPKASRIWPKKRVFVWPKARLSLRISKTRPTKRLWQTISSTVANVCDVEHPINNLEHGEYRDQIRFVADSPWQNPWLGWHTNYELNPGRWGENQIRTTCGGQPTWPNRFCKWTLSSFSHSQAK